MKKLLVFFLDIYKSFLSKIGYYFFGPACRFTPTCSDYTRESIKKYGIIKGGLFSLKRIIRCNPFVRPGYDPVP